MQLERLLIYQRSFFKGRDHFLGVKNQEIGSVDIKLFYCYDWSKLNRKYMNKQFIFFIILLLVIGGFIFKSFFVQEEKQVSDVIVEESNDEPVIIHLFYYNPKEDKADTTSMDCHPKFVRSCDVSYNLEYFSMDYILNDQLSGVVNPKTVTDGFTAEPFNKYDFSFKSAEIKDGVLVIELNDNAVFDLLGDCEMSIFLSALRSFGNQIPGVDSVYISDGDMYKEIN